MTDISDWVEWADVNCRNIACETPDRTPNCYYCDPDVPYGKIPCRLWNHRKDVYK